MQPKRAKDSFGQALSHCNTLTLVIIGMINMDVHTECMHSVCTLYTYTILK